MFAVLELTLAKTFEFLTLREVLIYKYYELIKYWKPDVNKFICFFVEI